MGPMMLFTKMQRADEFEDYDAYLPIGDAFEREMHLIVTFIHNSPDVETSRRERAYLMIFEETTKGGLCNEAVDEGIEVKLTLAQAEMLLQLPGRASCRV